MYACMLQLPTATKMKKSPPKKTSKALKCKPSALVVDSMRESIHALRCDFLCLQDTQRKRECAIQLIDGLGYFVVVSR